MSSPISSFLRRALLVDGIMTGATAVLILAASGYLERWLDVPATLLRYAGLVLIPFVAYVLFLSTRTHASRGSVWVVIAINVAWVAASIVLLLSSQIQPNALGYAFVIVQAVAVAVFAYMQRVGLRGLDLKHT